MAVRINIGCGGEPTPEWQNYDNSWSIRLARRPILTYILDKLNLLNEKQKKYIDFVKTTNIKWADATKHIPQPDRSVAALYSSHMLEHFDKKEANIFLKEARRILQPGGIIRLVVPNLRFFVDNYVKDCDAEEFMNKTNLTRPKPKTFFEKLRHLIIGARQHQWMYDGESLCQLLLEAGFKEPRIIPAGHTTIPDPGALNLNERSLQSVFVEAVNP